MTEKAQAQKKAPEKAEKQKRPNPKGAGRKNKGQEAKFDPKCASLIKALAQYGVPQRSILKIVQEQGYDIGWNKMLEIYQSEWEAGFEVGNAKLAEIAYKRAMDGNNSLLIFLLKTRLGWIESVKIDNVSSDGSMTPKKALDINLSQFSAEELVKMSRAAFRGE